MDRPLAIGNSHGDVITWRPGMGLEVFRDGEPPHELFHLYVTSDGKQVFWVGASPDREDVVRWRNRLLEDLGYVPVFPERDYPPEEDQA